MFFMPFCSLPVSLNGLLEGIATSALSACPSNLNDQCNRGH